MAYVSDAVGGEEWTYLRYLQVEIGGCDNGLDIEYNRGKHSGMLPEVTIIGCLEDEWVFQGFLFYLGGR